MWLLKIQRKIFQHFCERAVIKRFGLRSFVNVSFHKIFSYLFVGSFLVYGIFAFSTNITGGDSPYNSACGDSSYCKFQNNASDGNKVWPFIQICHTMVVRNDILYCLAVCSETCEILWPIKRRYH